MPISKPFDLLIFGLFGLTRPEDLKLSPHVGEWTIVLFKIVFLVYLFSDLMGDLAKFATILMIFMFGFNMVVLSMNQPYFALTGIGLLPWPSS